MRRLAAALGLAALALAAAWALQPDPSGTAGEEAPSESSEAVPLALEVRATLTYDLERRRCPSQADGECTTVVWRPNVQASALAPGSYEARVVLEGTGVANDCSFLSPAAHACEDTAADARTPGYRTEIVPESREGGEICRAAEATLENAGVWVARDVDERCVDVPEGR